MFYGTITGVLLVSLQIYPDFLPFVIHTRRQYVLKKQELQGGKSYLSL